MAIQRLKTALKQMRQLVGARGLAELNDGQLLKSFLERRDEAAFAALVSRHGPLVLGVCRRLLPNEHDAEDAFQATFLVLFRRSRFLNREGSLANWLYTVAYHAALRAKSNAARRQRHERQAADMRREEPQAEHAWHDLQPVIDAEVSRLPTKYRLPILLCYLQGKTHEEAARQLAWPVGTVKGRLARARTLLRTRLKRRGILLPTALLGCGLSEKAQAAVPALLLDRTVKLVSHLAAGNAVMAFTSVSANALAEGVLKTMLVTKLKIVTTILLVISVAGLGAGTLAHHAWARQNAEEMVADLPGIPKLAERGRTPTPRGAGRADNRSNRGADAHAEEDETAGERLGAEEVISKSFTTPILSRMVVDSFDGSIDVKTGANGATKIKVTKASRAADPQEAKDDLQNVIVTVGQEADAIRITARQANKNARFHRSVAVAVELPAGAAIEVHSDNGTITLDGPTGDVAASCSNGAIRVNGSKGKLTLTSSNGTIGFTGVLPAGDHSFLASNGAISLTLPADAQFRVDAEMNKGKISSDFPVKLTEPRSEIRLCGSVGERPAASIKLRLSNGSIELRREK